MQRASALDADGHLRGGAVGGSGVRMVVGHHSDDSKGASMPIADVARRMLDTYPRDVKLASDVLVECIASCTDCAPACTQCADECLSEDQPQSLVKCIGANLDCADLCAATARVISRQTEYDASVSRALLEACVAACGACGDECERHAEHGMEHCRVRAEQCRQCEDACRRMAAAMS
jgi:hypothetical protein